jgi:hypothetical protein
MTRRSRILSNLLLSLPLATTLLCAAPHAGAQNSASFTVPFAFSANNQNVPAGSYNVQPVSSCILALHNVKTGRRLFLMVLPNDSGRAIETQSRLVFRRYGTHAYLTQVWSSGTSTHSELVVQPKTERDLAKGSPQAGSSFEVALK